MNEIQANQEGLNFTGIYSSNKEEVKARIAQERLLYPKARLVIVNSPHSKLSRSGPGMGYSVYADSIYRAYQTIEESKKVIQNYASSLDFYKKKFEDEKAKLNEQLDKAQENLRKSLIVVYEQVDDLTKK